MTASPSTVARLERRPSSAWYVACITNPAILVEVLSSSTEEYDRGLTWTGYQRIGSLTDYLLVAQADVRIEHYRRNADGSWTYRTAGPGEHVALTGGGELAVDAIYAGVFELPGD
jgi:Uma2 family endonuclease